MLAQEREAQMPGRESIIGHAKNQSRESEVQVQLEYSDTSPKEGPSLASLSLVDAIQGDKHQEVLEQNAILVSKVSSLESELETLRQ